MTKEIRPLQRYNENTEQTEIFYPATTTDAIAHPTKRKSLTNVISDIEEAYAKQTGYYETLGAGTATNLRGVNPTEGTFTFRPSGGNADVANGTAYLERIKGNTVKWNQLLRANKLVDMGLPSGTLWATCDIDVTKADKFCETPFTYEKSFLSWGNIDGHNPSSVSAFDYDWGGRNGSAPYYEGQPYGSTPGSTLAGSIAVGKDFDAARANLGASWRMPTNAEFVELFANIRYINADGTEVDTTKTDKRVIVNGVRGLYVESTINGARLFFSCSGRGEGRSWNYRATFGGYWSSRGSSALDSRCLYFGSSSVSPQDYRDRYLGLAVRPVTNSAIVTDENGHKYAVSARYLIDLTLMFGAGNEPSTAAEFETMFGEDYYAYDTGHLGILADATYSDAASFKTAMAGVPLYYELATPLIYELDNFQLPLPYRVDDYGTEEIKGAENSVAPTLNIRYGINAGDTITNLPKNYISAESIDQLLATMSSAMGGTWTKTWDAANGRYTFSFTQAATLNLAPTEPEPEQEY